MHDLRLVTPSQWRDCRAVVRAFARDLPAFDSVWIDALVQTKVLTLFQAERVSSGAAASLCVADYLLVDQQRRDECLTVFEARHRGTQQRVNLTRITLALAQVDESEIKARLQALSGWARQAGAPSRALRQLPTEAFINGDAAWFISPVLSGKSAASLLVRRGRFPVNVVEAIAAQFLRLLKSAEELGCLHGDIRPVHVHLSPNGQVSLPGHGLLTTLLPVISMHDAVPLDVLDGLAPERIRQPLQASAESELYAAGCVLWQLLAGRPPYMAADPLDKRACHVRQRVPDIRDFAPEASAALAQLILAMTNPVAEQRRADVAQAASRFRASTSESRLAMFLKNFETASPRAVASKSERRLEQRSSGLGTLATAMLLALTVSLGVVARPYVQQWLKSSSSGVASNGVVSALPAGGQSGVVTASLENPASSPDLNIVLELPQPAANGVLSLQGGRKYRAGHVKATGDVVVKSTGGLAKIVVESPFTVTAQSLTLSGIELELGTSAERADEPALQVQAKTLTIERCQFLAPLSGRLRSPGVTIRWSGIDPLDVSATRLRVSDTAFLATGTVFVVDTPLMGAAFENVLKTGPGTLLDLQSGTGAGYRVPVVLDRTTLRDSGSLVHVPMDVLARSGEMVISGEDSALATDRSAPLILLTGELLDPEWHKHFAVVSQGIVLHRRTQFAAFQGTTGSSEARIMSPIDTSRLEADGLLSDSFTFTGDNLRDPVDNVAIANANPLRIPGSPFGAILQSLQSLESWSEDAALPVQEPTAVVPRVFPVYNEP